jgi:Flp pilus assembly protein TadD
VFPRLFFLLTLLALSSLPSSGAANPPTLEGVRTLVDSGETLKARIVLEGYLKDSPGDLEASQLLSRVYLLEGKPKAALETLLKFAGPSAGPEYNWILGLILLELGRNEEALAQLKLASSYGSDYRYAMDWGAAAWRMSRTDVALSAYARAQQLAPGEPWPRLNRAMILEATGKAAAALETLSEALRTLEGQGVPRTHPAYPDLYYWSGQALEKLGRRRDAKTAYQKALSFDGNYSSARRALEALK